MRNLFSGALICGLALAAGQVSAQTRELGGSGELLDGIAALVDSGVVLKSQLKDRLALVSRNFTLQQLQLPPEQRSQLPPLSELEQQVLERLILEEAQLQRAENIGIEIGDDMLNSVLTEYATTQGVTLEQLPALVAETGDDYQAFRAEWRRDVTIRQLENVQVVRQIAINPREFEQCVAQIADSETDEFDYYVSHILVSFAPDASSAEIAEAEERARDLVRQLDEGAEFGQLAVANSDSQTALEAGALGWRKGSALPTVFAADILRMDVGEHSRPIRSTGGFHLVRLNDMRGAEPQLVDQIRVRHILLAPNEVLDDDATRQRLQGIRNQILDGDDFATIAEAVSEDPLSAVEGGDLGWRAPDDYWPEFVAVVTTLGSEEISEPFRTPDGWHIAEVTGLRSFDMTEELRESECRQILGQRKVDEELEIWRRRIRDEAYVVKRI